LKTIKTSSGKIFEQIDGESILDCAEKAGIKFQYSCRTGRCSTCKCKVISGKTSTYNDELGLTELEKMEGYILSCVRYAEENTEIEVDDLGDIKIPKPQTVPCKISKLEMLAEDVIQIILRMPPSTSFNFIPGQYIDLIGPKGIKRSYSIANNITNNSIELHIKKVINGSLSKYWFDDAKLDDLLRLHGPLGTFFLRDGIKKDIIFLATGTGVAPVKAILESIEILSNSDPRSITVIWGGRKKDDLYIDYFRKNLNIDFIPVLSRPSSDWKGEIGYVQNIVLDKKYDLSNSVVYACGLDSMIKSAKKILVDNGLDKSDFYSDAFVDSSDIMHD
jgi:CDP-4-dehydro-6-deoxyglucose reductase, E3